MTVNELMIGVLLVGSWIVQTDGESPLHGASWGGHVEVVRALVDAGANVGQATVSACLRSVALMTCSWWHAADGVVCRHVLV